MIPAAYLIIVFTTYMGRDVSTQSIPFATYEKCESAKADIAPIAHLTTTSYCIHTYGGWPQ